MGWADLESQAVKACISTFGEQISYTSQGRFPVTIMAIETQPPEDFPQAVESVLYIRLADLPVSPERGDTLVWDDTVYEVQDMKPDQEGGMKLMIRQP